VSSGTIQDASLSTGHAFVFISKKKKKKKKRRRRRRRRIKD